GGLQGSWFPAQSRERQRNPTSASLSIGFFHLGVRTLQHIKFAERRCKVTWCCARRGGWGHPPLRGSCSYASCCLRLARLFTTTVIASNSVIREIVPSEIAQYRHQTPSLFGEASRDAKYSEYATAGMASTSMIR